MRSKRVGDIDSQYHAIRARLTALRAAAPPPSNVVPPHGHAAANITFDETQSDGSGRLSADDVQEALEELDSEKLARSGEQPMLGNLDMNHNDVNNVRDLEVEGDVNMTGATGDINMSGGVGSAVLSFVRNIVMTGIGIIDQVRRLYMVGEALIDFTGSDGVGSSVIDQPRVIHMAGDDDDDEARVDGLEAVVFNDEPTKSYVQDLSRTEWNTAVDLGDFTSIEGIEAWLATERDKVTVVTTGATTTYIADGWTVLLSTVSESAGDVTRGQLVVTVDVNAVMAWFQAGAEHPRLTSGARIVGIAMSDAAVGERVAVMKYGLMRGLTKTGEEWSNGDVLYSDGTLTNSPTGPPDPIVLAGTVMFASTSGGDTTDANVFVDVRVMPTVAMLSGVDALSPATRDSLLFDAATSTWVAKPTRRSADYATDFTVQVDEYLARVDASGGMVIATLPPAADSTDVVVNVKKVDDSSNAVRIDGDGSDLIDGELTFDLLVQGESVQLQSDGTSWAII